MATVLYIQASPMNERSYSTRCADAFIEAYRKTHPGDTVKTLKLFDARIPMFDLAAASAKYKIIHGKEHTAEDKKIWDKVVATIEEFKAADKYVIAVPMWNFSIPWRLKQYIDVIVQPGLAFSVDASGNYTGLIQNKKAFICYATGGKYPEGTPGEAYDMQKRYIKLILGFVGITDVKSIAVEPTLAEGPDAAKKALEETILKAKKEAEKF